ncbi:MAG: sulfatase-like hydrolase/transferase, partial [Armatimonadota bacterium]|nr:sulfatase-like hydrolase/transferase [Armatimonadota bacterium]
GAYHGHGLSFQKLTPRQRRECTAAYYAMIELLDEQTGRILAALDETGQTENTLVIFMSDHGEMLGDHGIYWKGCYFYEPLVRVPLILCWPGHFPAGVRSDALVELHDLAPTLLQLAGLEVPERMQARSLLPLLTGAADASEHRQHVLCEYYRCLGGAPPDAHGTMLCDGRYKICVYHHSEPGELYDLQEDPEEYHNLWDDPGYAALKLELLKRCLDAAVVQTLDPWPPQRMAF